MSTGICVEAKIFFFSRETSKIEIHSICNALYGHDLLSDNTKPKNVQFV